MENEAKLTELNGRLRERYEPYLQFLKNEFSAEADFISLPHLMKVVPSYFNGKQKILFVGKEFGEWYGNIKDDDKCNVNYLMDIYEQVNLLETNDEPFWNFLKSINERINGSSTEGFMWTSLSKFNFNESTPPPEVHIRNNRTFDLLRDEIEILQPDMVFFLTGYSYDEHLRRMYHGIQYKPIKDNVLYKVVHDELPEQTHIVLHPRALEDRGLYDSVKNEILKEILVLQD
ncbi:MAG TPA: hypothetical protein VE912_21955 [Bacteroidales bacterium]|nr:hypothetical protein [Bacteroidales bacterium]